MLYFAYDGSIHGDWLFRYALHLARHHAQRGIHLIHVQDELVDERRVAERLRHLRQDCDTAEVGLEVSTATARRGQVARQIVDLVEPGPDSFLLCGTRRQPRNMSYLAGTVAETLIAQAPSQVIAIRVVQPGLLGAPRNFLLPVRGDLAEINRGAPLLRLFAPDMERAHLLLVKTLGRLQFQHLVPERASRILADGYREIGRVERTIREALALDRLHLDTVVVISDDAPKEIVIHANQLKSQLVLMGASGRSVPRRFLYGNPLEQVLRNAPCDVAIYRGLA